MTELLVLYRVVVRSCLQIASTMQDDAVKQPVVSPNTLSDNICSIRGTSSCSTTDKISQFVEPVYHNRCGIVFFGPWQPTVEVY
jgi:hypothetical protein